MKQQTILLPYGKRELALAIGTERLNRVLVPPASDSDSREERDIVREALEHPIGTPALSTLAEGKKSVVIITSDHTRAVPSAITLPLLLEEVRKGNPEAEITIIIATGLHRGMTPEEMLAKFGEEICSRENLINHDAFQGNDYFIDLGRLPSGSKCEINKIAIEADLLIAEGFIEPHFFAGFSGGRKSVLPGIASQDCVNINHSAKAIAHPKSTTGVLDGNPIHEDMIVAAQKANVAFILNVLLDEKKRITAAFSGDVDQAHRAGTARLFEGCGVTAEKTEIVVTTNGGYPLDQNLYQCPKGLATALACVKDKGVIILVAACEDGLGGENFGTLMQKGTPQELQDMILAINPEKTISEQWCVQRFAEALLKYSIILVSELDKDLVEKMHFIHAATIGEALDKAYSFCSPEAKVTVIPDGVAVIVRSDS